MQSECRECSKLRERRRYRDVDQALRRVWRRLCIEVYGSCRLESIAEADATLRERGEVVLVRGWWSFEGFARDMAAGFVPGRTWRHRTPGAVELGPETVRWVERPPRLRHVVEDLEQLSAAEQEIVINACGLSNSARAALLEHFGLLDDDTMR